MFDLKKFEGQCNEKKIVRKKMEEKWKINLK